MLHTVLEALWETWISLLDLRWTNERYYAPLPPGVQRTYVSTEAHGKTRSTNKQLELLVTSPNGPDDAPTGSWLEETHSTRHDIHRDSVKRPPPILFLHGGFGSAAMFIPFMTYMAQTSSATDHSSQPRYNRNTYAVSLRGHGASYTLPYLRMVYGTSLHHLTLDLVSAVHHIRRLENGAMPIIVAHSSGGGLVQYALANSCFGCDESSKIPGLVLLDAVPNFGNISVYANWARHDPAFSVRMLGHLQHVKSPLANERLIYNAFFGQSYRAQDQSRCGEKKGEMIRDFMQLTTPYDSLLWPLQMMKGWMSWARGRGGNWLDARHVLANIDFKSGLARDRVCIMVGAEDKLMDVPNQEEMVKQYRDGVRALKQGKRAPTHSPEVLSKGSLSEQDLVALEGTVSVVPTPALTSGSQEAARRRRLPSLCDEGDAHKRADAALFDAVSTTSEHSVCFAVVSGAGHHIQNDIMWENVAESVRQFALQTV